MEDRVQLGYPSQRNVDGTDLSESRLGGKALWITGPPEQPPCCALCHRELDLLCQVHAPLVNLYERSVLVFACDGTECSAAGEGWVVYRDSRNHNGQASVPANEEPHRDKDPMDVSACEPEDEWGIEDDVELDDLEGLLQLRDMKLVPSSAVEADEDPITPHKLQQEKQDQYRSRTESGSEIMQVEQRKLPDDRWRCVGIDWGAEPSGRIVDEEEMNHILELKSRYEADVEAAEGGIAAGSETWQGEEYEKDNLSEDRREFRKMMKRIEISPQQCIRYCYGHEVLWLRPMRADIPPCGECGSSRVPELQLLPNVIYLIGEDRIAEGMDWGTAVVYTCSQSCTIRQGPVREFVVVQGS